MTNRAIEAKRMQNNVKFELAKQIRALLDEARKAYGAEAWDDDDLESEVLALVTDDD